ncbi:hypothetical protein ACJMK2_036648 [Sinanodonta woodiana]|uniref:Vacuolar protein sorting-associated protein 54 n=1 Tax=Sinanodonta woodiana TaxID=1069815 RepID=A0ABD3WHW0_SINWO
MSSIPDSRQHEKRTIPWKQCTICKEKLIFKSPREFTRHLRDFHCTKEGGSYVCRYGLNDVCPSLPVEGVSDRDYEDHIARDHVCNQPGSDGRLKGFNHVNVQSRPAVSPNMANSEPSVVQDQHRWTMFNASVNLPAALNDPRLMKRETDFFSKTWGQDFYEKTYIPPSPYLPDIEKFHFEKYLHRTAGRLKKHQKHLHGLSQLEEQETFLTKTVKQTVVLKNICFQLFMNPNFNLENPETFNAVFPWTQVEESRVDNSGTRHSSKLLQEKLSHYLDVVEVQIARQISMRSEAFFVTMTSHDRLQEKMKTTLGSIKHLRDKIHALDELMARGSLRVLKYAKAKANHAKLYKMLKLMATVHQTQPTIQTLLSTSEFVGALDLIATTQEVLSQELAGIHSFRHLGSQLAELAKVIDIMMQEDFLKYVSSELNRPVADTVPLTDEERLVAVLFGMLRLQRLDFIELYREEAFTAMKAVVKQTVIEAVLAAEDIDAEDNTGRLADHMRRLNYKQWMQLVMDLFSNFLVILNRAKAFHGIASDVIGIAAGKTKAPTPVTNTTEDNMNSLEQATHLNVSVNEEVDVMLTTDNFNKATVSLREMLYSIGDHAHDRCVKVMNARAKDGFLERLSSVEFVALSREVEKFVTDSECICGRRSMSLRGSLQSQANRIVNRFHDERKIKLSLILDNERWKQADVPTEFQLLVDHISITGKLSLPEKKTDAERKPGEFLTVDEQRFAVVGTVLMLLKMIVEYCQIVDDIPSVAPDLLTRLIDLLKTFNSRTCQLVLGAGALELVGLKTISTKNLALASRCLQLIVYFMPRLRKHFESKLVSKSLNMLKYFDQILKDYKDHIEEISNKLVTIMESMVHAQLSRWEVKAPMPSPCFRAVCKQMSKLHEAVIGILPEDQVKIIFIGINKTFKRLLREQLLKLNVTNDGGPQHGLVTSDLAFYAGSFKTLRGLEGLANEVNDVWERR